MTHDAEQRIRYHMLAAIIWNWSDLILTIGAAVVGWFTRHIQGNKE